MNHIIIQTTFMFLLLLITGCAGVSEMQPYTQNASPTLQGNYRVIKYNAIGESTGYSLLGIIPLKPSSYSLAMSDLWTRAGIEEGTATALVNVTKDDSYTYLILFSISSKIIRAEIIEFTPLESPVGQPVQGIRYITPLFPE